MMSMSMTPISHSFKVRDVANLFSMILFVHVEWLWVLGWQYFCWKALAEVGIVPSKLLVASESHFSEDNSSFKHERCDFSPERYVYAIYQFLMCITAPIYIRLSSTMLTFFWWISWTSLKLLVSDGFGKLESTARILIHSCDRGEGARDVWKECYYLTFLVVMLLHGSELIDLQLHISNAWLVYSPDVKEESRLHGFGFRRHSCIASTVHGPSGWWQEHRQDSFWYDT